MKYFASLFCAVLLSACALLVGSPVAWGQAATGRVFGTVLDQQGAAVPQAKVTVTNEATQVFETTVTNDEGYFEVLDLPIGSYTVTVEHDGFTKYVTMSNRLLINQSLKFEITLKIGAPDQIVTVESQATQVETANPTIGQSVTSRPIVDLPLNGRNVLDLALLQPGVTATNPDNAGAGNVNIAGGRSDSVTYLLDGGLNNEIVGNAVVLNPNPDTIQEFRILSSNYTAEYGRNGGGIISVVTKSGTNSLHGSAFDYARNTDFDANSYFNKLEGLPVSDLKRHQFGGTVGGPITIPHVVHGKDRFFFFFGYQGQRQTTSNSESEIPTFTPAELGGDFSQAAVNGGPDPNVAAFLQANPFFVAPNGNAANAIIDPTKINSVSAAFIKLGLIPTSPTGLISTAATGTNNANELTGKVDILVTQKDKIAVTIGGSRNPTLTPFVHADVPGFPETGSNNNYFANIAYTRTFSANLLNELRFTAQRNNFTQDFPGTTLPSPTQLGFGITPDKVLGPPDFDFDTGLTLGLSVQGPTDFVSNVYAVTDTVSWVKGHNTWKFGAGFTAYQNNTLFDFFGNGDFSFSAAAGVGSGNSLADFLLGIPSFYTEGPNAPNNIRTKATYGFGQDEWRVKSNFTLTLGLRYEYNTPKQDTQGRTFDVIPGFQSTRFPNAPVGLAFPGDPGAPRGLNFPDKDNFGPRFGFAWDPWNNGKTSVRGGFGIFYDILKGEDNLQFNGAPPFFSEVSANGGAPYPTVSQSMNNGTCCPVPYFADPFLTAGEGGISQPGINPFPSKPVSRNIDFVQAGFLPWNSSGSIFLVDPHLHTPYTYQYNLDIQHELAKSLVAEINYVGSSSKGLTGLVDLNPIVLNTFNRVLNNTPQTNAGILNFCTPSGPDPGGINPGDCPYEGVPEFQNIGFASYNSLEASLTRQVADSKFLGTTYFTLAYTYSHNIDNSSGFQNRTSNVPAYNINQFRGSSDFDVRHRISFAGGWDLPFDRAWSSGPKLLTSGWSLYPILSWQTGFPLSINANFAGGFPAPDDPGPAADGDPGLVHALFAPGVTSQQTMDPKTSSLNTPTTRFYFNPNNFAGFSPIGGGSTPQFDPATPCNQQVITNELPSSNCAVANPALRTEGLPRNFFFGPGRTNLDLALAKAIPIKENFKAILRLEAFNVFNHAQFANPDVSLASPTFGQITNTADNGVTNAPGGPRILQVALRLTF